MMARRLPSILPPLTLDEALESTAIHVLDAASRQFHLSARSCHRLMKVARTIADLAGAERITTEHLAEAVQFRLEG